MKEAEERQDFVRKNPRKEVDLRGEGQRKKTEGGQDL